jgi:hypothetical protein
MGGRTVLWNEVCVCVTCHSLLHLGLLKIEERADGTYRWWRKSDDLDLDLDLRKEEREVAAIPILVPRFGGPESAIVNGAGGASRAIEDSITKLIGKFQGAGIPGSHAAERVHNAYARLAKAGKCDPSDEELLEESLKLPDSADPGDAGGEVRKSAM